jgi:hypothetical protein
LHLIYFFCSLCCHFNCWIYIGRLLSWLLTIFTNRFFYILCSYVLQNYLLPLYLSLQYVAGLFLLLSFFTYSLSFSVCGCCILYIVGIFLVFLSTFLILLISN